MYCVMRASVPSLHNVYRRYDTCSTTLETRAHKKMLNACAIAKTAPLLSNRSNGVFSRTVLAPLRFIPSVFWLKSESVETKGTSLEWIDVKTIVSDEFCCI